jgi:hypothetical protein
MGYSFYSPLIMYGFEEEEEEYGRVLDNEWLHKTYGQVYSYAGDICNIVGIICKLDPYTGAIKFSKEDHEALLRVKADYEKYHNTKVDIKYISAICGDYQNEEGTYTLANTE